MCSCFLGSIVITTDKKSIYIGVSGYSLPATSRPQAGSSCLIVFVHSLSPGSRMRLILFGSSQGWCVSQGRRYIHPAAFY